MDKNIFMGYYVMGLGIVLFLFASFITWINLETSMFFIGLFFVMPITVLIVYLGRMLVDNAKSQIKLQKEFV